MRASSPDEDYNVNEGKVEVLRNNGFGRNFSPDFLSKYKIRHQIPQVSEKDTLILLKSLLKVEEPTCNKSVI